MGRGAPPWCGHLEDGPGDPARRSVLHIRQHLVQASVSPPVQGIPVPGQLNHRQVHTKVRELKFHRCPVIKTPSNFLL